MAVAVSSTATKVYLYRLSTFNYRRKMICRLLSLLSIITDSS
nr:MAG TPA: hypothetical protein [Caudoviricetes sp.]